MNEQRNAIIEQAARMFVNEGIKSVRMDDIAREAGISKRTLYETFGDKEELIFLAVKHHFTYYERLNDGIVKESPNILIATIRIMQNVVNSSESNWKLHNTLSRFYPTVSKRLTEYHKGQKSILFRDRLKDGVQEKLLMPHANIDLAMSTLHYLATSVVINDGSFPLPDGLTPKDAFLEVTVNVMRGISTAKGIAIIDEYLEKSK
ncbi:MAG: TetR/AcrR family transcriptional regulator [Rikenellaceae bacterium]